MGIKLELSVQWPQTLDDNGCDDHTKPGPCTGQIDVWLLAHYAISGTSVTGTIDTCKDMLPPVPLSVTGTQAEGLDPSKGSAVVQLGFADSVWTDIIGNPSHVATQTAGTLGGWNVGSSLRIDPTDSIYGLNATSPWASDKTVWPSSEAMFAASDVTDDDHDGHPGITATPSQAAGYVLPTTEVAFSPPYGPFADKLYVVMRTELSLYGTSTSCTDVSGTAGVELLNSHVIGCELADGGGDCTQSQWDFLDGNSTVYVGNNVTIPPGISPASFAPPGITGSFAAKVLSTDAAGGGVTCGMVINALP